MTARANRHSSSMCTIKADSIAKPSYTLEKHWNSGEVQKNLKAKNMTMLFFKSMLHAPLSS
jgi:hypothetical protein